MEKKGRALFITGTGTDVGKTFVTALVVKRLRDAGRNAGYYKAAISGAEKTADGRLLAGDALYVNEVAGLGETQENLVSYVYEEAVSPHLAARLNRREIDFDRVEKDFRRAQSKYDYLTMEGSGGIICPLRWDEACHVILDDLVCRLGLGTLVVADAGLGTINAAVLTVEHLRARGILVKGIILNRFHPGDAMEEDNRVMVEALTNVKVVATVRDGDERLDMDAKALAALYA
ncbi:MAG: dethiobiotin synthase [Schwartzia sp.]|nr:dethiobiotin synthase [Schwartzia sp. (in: firmicutes)]